MFADCVVHMYNFLIFYNNIVDPWKPRNKRSGRVKTWKPEVAGRIHHRVCHLYKFILTYTDYTFTHTYSDLNLERL